MHGEAVRGSRGWGKGGRGLSHTKTRRHEGGAEGRAEKRGIVSHEDTKARRGNGGEGRALGQAGDGVGFVEGTGATRGVLPFSESGQA